MKTSENIIAKLKKDSRFRSLAKHRCYDKFLGMLPPRFKNAIAFIYLKSNTMHIALNHPGYKMELNYNKKLLLELLQTLTSNDLDCTFLKANQIVLFNSKYSSFENTSKNQEETIPYYNELAKGEFDILSTNPKLEEQFQKIRDNILKNNMQEG